MGRLRGTVCLTPVACTGQPLDFIGIAGHIAAVAWLIHVGMLMWVFQSVSGVIFVNSDLFAESSPASGVRAQCSLLDCLAVTRCRCIVMEICGTVDRAQRMHLGSLSPLCPCWPSCGGSQRGEAVNPQSMVSAGRMSPVSATTRLRLSINHHYMATVVISVIMTSSAGCPRVSR
jgi:hypothetical protein